MTFTDLVEKLPAHVVNRASNFMETSVLQVFAGDLMSDVLVTDFEDLLIVTSLASEQVIRTADIVGAKGVLLVNDKDPPLVMKQLAEKQDLNLLSTPLSMYEACVSLNGIFNSLYRTDMETNS
jgi:hypothetical protein